MADEKIVKCKVYSKANHPVTIKYDGEELTLSPFAKGLEFADMSKLECKSNKVRIVKG